MFAVVSKDSFVSFLTVLHVVSSLFLVLLVLLQSGKGAELSSSFSGSSQTIFGSSGGANIFTKMTALFAATFMGTALLSSVLSSSGNKKSVFEGQVIPSPSASPLS